MCSMVLRQQMDAPAMFTSIVTFRVEVACMPAAAFELRGLSHRRDEDPGSAMGTHGAVPKRAQTHHVQAQHHRTV